jgi:hypothetical protein
MPVRDKFYVKQDIEDFTNEAINSYEDYEIWNMT